MYIYAMHVGLLFPSPNLTIAGYLVVMGACFGSIESLLF